MKLSERWQEVDKLHMQSFFNVIYVCYFNLWLCYFNFAFSAFNFSFTKKCIIRCSISNILRKNIYITLNYL